jgi:hypothetical protein
MIIGNFDNPLSPIDKSFRQKVNKETSQLNDTIDQINLADIYRVFHSATTQHTFSASHEISPK